MSATDRQFWVYELGGAKGTVTRDIANYLCVTNRAMTIQEIRKQFPEHDKNKAIKRAVTILYERGVLEGPHDGGIIGDANVDQFHYVMRRERKVKTFDFISKEKRDSLDSIDTAIWHCTYPNTFTRESCIKEKIYQDFEEDTEDPSLGRIVEKRLRFLEKDGVVRRSRLDRSEATWIRASTTSQENINLIKMLTAQDKPRPVSRFDEEPQGVLDLKEEIKKVVTDKVDKTLASLRQSVGNLGVILDKIQDMSLKQTMAAEAINDLLREAEKVKSTITDQEKAIKQAVANTPMQAADQLLAQRLKRVAKELHVSL